MRIFTIIFSQLFLACVENHFPASLALTDATISRTSNEWRPQRLNSLLLVWTRCLAKRMLCANTEGCRSVQNTRFCPWPSLGHWWWSQRVNFLLCGTVVLLRSDQSGGDGPVVSKPLLVWSNRLSSPNQGDRFVYLYISVFPIYFSKGRG